jgi:uncharacterized protein (DUF4415 family)
MRENKKDTVQKTPLPPLGTDFSKLDAHTLTAQEYEEIPELTDAWFAAATVYTPDNPPPYRPRKVGRPAGSGTKEMATIRVDKDIMEHFKKNGPGWQTRINAALREHMVRLL